MVEERKKGNGSLTALINIEAKNRTAIQKNKEIIDTLNNLAQLAEKSGQEMNIVIK